MRLLLIFSAVFLAGGFREAYGGLAGENLENLENSKNWAAAHAMGQSHLHVSGAASVMAYQPEPAAENLEFWAAAHAMGHSHLHVSGDGSVMAYQPEPAARPESRELESWGYELAGPEAFKTAMSESKSSRSRGAASRPRAAEAPEAARPESLVSEEPACSCDMKKALELGLREMGGGIFVYPPVNFAIRPPKNYMYKVYFAGSWKPADAAFRESLTVEVKGSAVYDCAGAEAYLKDFDLDYSAHGEPWLLPISPTSSFEVLSSQNKPLAVYELTRYFAEALVFKSRLSCSSADSFSATAEGESAKPPNEISIDEQNEEEDDEDDEDDEDVEDYEC